MSEWLFIVSAMFRRLVDQRRRIGVTIGAGVALLGVGGAVGSPVLELAGVGLLIAAGRVA